MSKIKIKEKGASSEIKIAKHELTVEGISDWLVSRNILLEGDKLNSYEDITEWHRSGGETYRCDFIINYINNDGEFVEKRINIKAITAIPIEETLKNWQRRRKHLSNNRIPVSNWYWYGKGVIIEDYYPLNYSCTKKVENLVDIAYTLDKLGYKNTRKFLSDIRCDKNGNPFYIDFGFDLGECDYQFKKDAINAIVNDPNLEGKSTLIKKHISEKLHYKKK